MKRSEEYRFETMHGPAEVLRRVGETAEQWVGEWQPAPGSEGGRLGLPVTAGLKRGWLAGELEVVEQGRGSRLLFKVDRGELRADRASVLVLSVGAAGGLVTIVAPFFPALWPLVPIGLLLGFSAWFMVVARLRTAGPAEFFAQVEGA